MEVYKPYLQGLGCAIGTASLGTFPFWPLAIFTSINMWVLLGMGLVMILGISYILATVTVVTPDGANHRVDMPLAMRNGIKIGGMLSIFVCMGIFFLSPKPEANDAIIQNVGENTYGITTADHFRLYRPWDDSIQVVQNVRSDFGVMRISRNCTDGTACDYRGIMRYEVPLSRVAQDAATGRIPEGGYYSIMTKAMELAALSDNPENHAEFTEAIKRHLNAHFGLPADAECPIVFTAWLNISPVDET